MEEEVDEVFGGGREDWRKVVMILADSSHGLADVCMERTADPTGGLATRLGNKTECLLSGVGGVPVSILGLMGPAHPVRRAIDIH